jgi:LytS/YehU family sensor histidine kinase
VPTAANFATLPRNIAIVAVFNTAIAAGIALARQGGFFESLIYSQCIGLLSLLSMDVPRRLLWGADAPPRAQLVFLSGAGMLVGFLGGMALASFITGRPFVDNRLVVAIAISLFAGVAGNWYFFNRERVAKLQLAAETIERGAVEARLKLLQAQIEPHFLFNTLANLHTLIASDPARAQKMLEHLNDYLRATLNAARRDSGTLGEEFALLRGYLEVLAIRMGPRLAFTLSLPEDLSGFRMPPMLLQPLVENAVKHGLEPKIDGGRVDVSASRIDGSLVVQIADTGLGLGNSSTKGTGVGLAHVRARVAATYGAKGSVKIEDRSDGVTTTVTLPA